MNLGAGTGQVAVGLGTRLAGVLALEPEPDMLVQLRRRVQQEKVPNLVGALAADADLPALAAVLGDGSIGLLTVANALHWMDPSAVFAAAHRLLRPGGGIAVITHGRPLWLGEREWTRALRGYLEQWFGPVTSSCGTDDQTREERRRLLEQTGFTDITVLIDHFQARLDTEFVLGHLCSALSPGQIPPHRHEEFATGLKAALQPFTEDAAGGLVEDVPVAVLVGRR